MPVGQTSRGRQTRARLLEAASEELLAQDGAVDFGAVAKRAGVSAGAPYRHFASKSELLVALVDGFYDEWEAIAYRPTFEEVLDSMTPPPPRSSPFRNIAVSLADSTRCSMV